MNESITPPSSDPIAYSLEPIAQTPEPEMDAQTAQWMDALIRENTEELEVIVEIPKGSHVKYEYDKKTQRIICDRILSTPFFYFFNYGYVPNTLSEDGDPLDVVVLMEDSLFPGCSIRCRVLGVLETSDEKGTDPKLIVCPVSRIDSFYDHLKDVMDVSVGLLNKIKHFFEHYKDLEKGKFVKVGHFLSSEDARRLLFDSRIAYYSQMIDNGSVFFLKEKMGGFA